MENFEESHVVVWNKKLILQTHLHDEKSGELIFDKISTITTKFTDELLKAVESYLPSDDIIAFKPLDQSTWNDDNSFIPPSITALAKMFKMDPVLLNKQFSTLSTSIIKDLTFWCVNQGSEPSFFWTEVLENFKVPVELTTLIKSAMAIPYSRYY